MRPSVRVAAFVGLLAISFAAAMLLGTEIDPVVAEDDHESEAATGGHDEGAPSTAALPGLAIAEGGYRLVPERTEFDRGRAGAFRFQIVTEGGETVRDFALEHERRMHLIVVGRDFSGFQHLHPRQLDDGSWEVDLHLGSAGVYRAFADFAVGEESLTLATDLFAGGRFTPAALPGPKRIADAGDGYEVEISSAAPSPGTNPIEFTVSHDGRELESVEPYLGADGHLVALREHDQAFLHTHPEGEAGGRGPIGFDVIYPTPGRYRLFLQFKHGGEVRTAAFTQLVSGDATAEGATDGH